MEKIRKPFQGVFNIFRFNWHFYLVSVGLSSIVFLLSLNFKAPYHLFSCIAIFLIISSTIISLFVSYYVYDLSDLYKLTWLDKLAIPHNSKMLNINAGFDETSILLKEKYTESELIVFDFYDPVKHTELSLKRARKAYPPFPGTQQVNQYHFPLPENYADHIFVVLSAHEIRSEGERITFFKELNRILKQKGKIVVTEHLKDVQNFLAYNIGFFHFVSKSSWNATFKNSDLKTVLEIKITPFITTFILEKNGTES